MDLEPSGFKCVASARRPRPHGSPYWALPVPACDQPGAPSPSGTPGERRTAQRSKGAGRCLLTCILREQSLKTDKKESERLKQETRLGRRATAGVLCAPAHVMQGGRGLGRVLPRGGVA